MRAATTTTNALTSSSAVAQPATPMPTTATASPVALAPSPQSTPPRAPLSPVSPAALTSHDACPLFPATSSPPPNTETRVRAAALAPPSSALRFTCCRCRRPFLVVPGPLRRAPPAARPYSAAPRAAAAAAAVHTAAASTTSSSLANGAHVPLPRTTTPHTLEAAVRASTTTAGTATHFRPLPGLSQAAEATLSSAAAAAAVTTTGVYSEPPFAAEDDGAEVEHGSAPFDDPALLAALPLDFFAGSAELLSTAQLTDLLHRAHRAGVVASEDARCRSGSLHGIASGTSLCGEAPAPAAAERRAPHAEPRVSHLSGTAGSPHATPAPAATAPSTSTETASAAKAAAVVVAPQQLRDFGIAVLPASALCLPRTPHPAKGSTPVRCGGSSPARGMDTEARPPSPPPASSTSTLPPPSLLSRVTEEGEDVRGAEDSSGADSDAGDAGGGPGARTITATATPPPHGVMSVDLYTPLTHPMVEDDVAASELQRAELESWATLPARRLPLEGLTQHIGAPAASLKPDLAPAGPPPAHSFEELCRRWMRLLARRAPPHEQPLCHDCWQESCLVPLQQRARQALDTAQTLTTSASPTAKAQLLTMCCAAPSPLPASSSCSEMRHDADAAAGLVRGLPLDAVAANLFGEEAQGLLSALGALAAPHTLSLALRGRADRSRVSPPSLEFSAPPSTFFEKDATDADAAMDEACRSMQRELEELERQQASLDGQLSELRSVLHALDATSLVFPGATRDCSGGGSGSGGGGVEGWPALAAAQNRREVHRAFTTGEEAAERQRCMAHLRTSLSYVSATSIDAFAFPVNVAGPIGLIAGLRLGLVPPYAGSVSGGGAVGVTEEPRGGGAEGSAGSALSAPASAAPWATDVAPEAVYLDGFVHRQVACAQLLLSGNTSADSGDAVGDAAGPPSAKGSAVTATTSTASAASANANVRVSPLEVNAACGYLLLLLNYLAHVNGFSFQSAVLRPAGDRSTVGLLKRVPIAAPGGAGAAGPRGSAGASSGFSFWGLFGGAAAEPTSPASPPPSHPVNGGGVSPARSARGSTAASAGGGAAAAATTYVVDSDVDFFLTDRLLAWRTFGPACVAVASCVKELADALHESLRCWRLRESMMRRPTAPPTASGISNAAAAEGSAPPSVTATQRSVATSTRHSARTAARRHHTPVPLPRLVEELCAEHELAMQNSDLYMSFPTSAAASTVPTTRALSANAERTVSVQESSGQTTPTPASRPLPMATSHEGLEQSPAPAAQAPPPVSFPVHPPFAIRGDTVDGFSVRHGSVTEAIWTLGMKKLLANVQWCMAATMELERLYAVTGDEGEEEAEEGEGEGGGAGDDGGGGGHANGIATARASHSAPL